MVVGVYREHALNLRIRSYRYVFYTNLVTRIIDIPAERSDAELMIFVFR
jgi:hypothetical protein